MTTPEAQSIATAADQPDSAASAGYRILRFKDPHAALGRAVLQLMGKPGFAQLRFGSWSRVLVGQINRNHYFFLEHQGAIVGFAGWSLATEAQGDAWMAGEGDVPSAAVEGGDCIIVNVWQSDDDAAQAEMVAQMRILARNIRLVYGRRSYADGRTRFIKMPMSRFVRRHIDRSNDQAANYGQKPQE